MCAVRQDEVGATSLGAGHGWRKDLVVDVVLFNAVSNETPACKLQEHRHMRKRWTAG